MAATQCIWTYRHDKGKQTEHLEKVDVLYVTLNVSLLLVPDEVV